MKNLCKVKLNKIAQILTVFKYLENLDIIYQKKSKNIFMPIGYELILYWSKKINEREH